ncbi:MAG: hypothetical protein HC904_14335 [Blastochloris sp.]|nr:hypothetical protein [Blastochloris sp.]
MASFWEILAQRLEEKPEGIAQALRTMERWVKQGQTAPMRLLRWRPYLEEAEKSSAGKARLKELLLDQSEEALGMKNFHPFAGILPREQRRKASELCTYRH